MFKSNFASTQHSECQCKWISYSTAVMINSEYCRLFRIVNTISNLQILKKKEIINQGPNCLVSAMNSLEWLTRYLWSSVWNIRFYIFCNLKVKNTGLTVRSLTLCSLVPFTVQLNIWALYWSLKVEQVQLFISQDSKRLKFCRYLPLVVSV